MLIAVTNVECNEILARSPGSVGPTSLLQLRAEPHPLRPLRWNGVEPTLENLASGRYPLAKPVHLVFRAPAGDGVRRFLAFLASPAGQALLRETGRPPRRLPVRPTDAHDRNPPDPDVAGGAPRPGPGPAPPLRVPPLLLPVSGGKRPGGGRVRGPRGEPHRGRQSGDVALRERAPPRGRDAAPRRRRGGAARRPRRGGRSRGRGGRRGPGAPPGSLLAAPRRGPRRGARRGDPLPPSAPRARGAPGAGPRSPRLAGLRAAPEPAAPGHPPGRGGPARVGGAIPGAHRARHRHDPGLRRRGAHPATGAGARRRPWGGRRPR